MISGRRRVRTALATGFLAIGLGALAAPASAQWHIPGPWAFAAPYGMEEAPLPPRAALGSALRHGYRPVSRPRFTGETYILDAMGPRGDLVRLVVDAYDGRLVGRARVASALVPPRPIGPAPALVPAAPPRGAVAREGPARKKAPARLEASRPQKAAPGAVPSASPAAPVPPVQSEAAAPPAAAAPPPVPAATAAVPAAIRAPETKPETPAIAPPAPEPVAAAAPPAPEPPAAAAAAAPAPQTPAPAAPRTVRVIEGVAPVASSGAQGQEPPKAGSWADPPPSAASE